MLRKIILIFSILFTQVSAYADEQKIGIISSLSGIGATWGNDVKNSLLFAKEKLAPHQYLIVIEDDRCSNKDGLTAANKLIHVNKVNYGLGFACSGPAISGAPIFNSSKIPLIISTASSPALTHVGEYVFRTFPHDGKGAELLYSYMIKQPEKKIGVFSTEADVNQDLKKAFESISKKINKLEVEYIDYLPEVVDYKSLFIKAKSKKIEALFLNVQTEQAYIQAIRNLKEIGWTPKIYSAYYPGNSSVLKSDIKSPDGTVYFDSPNLDKILTSDGKELLKEFEEKYGKLKTSQLVFVANFEAFRALNQAIKDGGTKEEVLQRLKSSRYNGIFGEWHFDENRQITGLDFVLKKIENGEIVDIL